MKFPKYRANVYCVMRTQFNDFTAVVGIFSELHAAEEYRDACKQEWLDKIGDDPDGVSFEVVISTFYG